MVERLPPTRGFESQWMLYFDFYSPLSLTLRTKTCHHSTVSYESVGLPIRHEFYTIFAPERASRPLRAEGRKVRPKAGGSCRRPIGTERLGERDHLHTTSPTPPSASSPPPTTPAMSAALVARSAFNRNVASALARRSLRPMALQGTPCVGGVSR